MRRAALLELESGIPNEYRRLKMRNLSLDVGNFRAKVNERAGYASAMHAGQRDVGRTFGAYASGVHLRRIPGVRRAYVGRIPYACAPGVR
jgi:hypothetical protein